MHSLRRPPPSLSPRTQTHRSFIPHSAHSPSPKPKLPAMYAPLDQILSRFRPIAPKPPASHLPSSPAPALQLRSRSRKRTKRQKPVPLSARPLVERDLLQKLQQPKLVAPRPVRPVGSTIRVRRIDKLAQFPSPPGTKRAEEVEREVELGMLPTVVSDCGNRVRMANSAYKELVGQPECMWLDFMDCRGFDLRPLSRRINGEVAIEFSGEVRVEDCLDGFSCRVEIEWACNGRKSFVDAQCDVVRVYCDSKEYFFTWKFHVGEAYRTDFGS